MPTLSFFPWCSFDRRYDYAHFSVVPIDLSASAAPKELSSSWADIKKVVEVYETRSNKPVEDVSILLLKDIEINADLDDEQITESFIYREIVTLCSLSKRSYFTHLGYIGADNLKMVLQRFQLPVSSPAVTTRRRDGTVTQGFSPGLFKERCPVHISPAKGISLDNELVLSLLKVYESGGDLWMDVHDSIQNFNLANTDSNDFRVQVELVLCVGALERMFGLLHGKEDELASAFLGTLKPMPENSKLPERKNLKADLSKYSSIREAFIRDMFRLRNRFAHGRNQTKYDFSWSGQEHLLLLSFIYPLLLKLVLQEKGFYKLTDDDQRKIFTFDYLLNINGTLKSVPGDQFSFIWNEFVGKARWDWLGMSK